MAPSASSVAKDFGNLCLDAAQPPNKIRRRNALTEDQFESAFPSSEAKDRLLHLWKSKEPAHIGPLHKDLEGLSLVVDEEERQRKRPAGRNRHMSERGVVSVQREGPAGTNSKSEGKEEKDRDRDRPRRRRLVRRKSGDQGQLQLQQNQQQSSSSNHPPHSQVASIRLHQDLVNLHRNNPPDVLPRSILRRAGDDKDKDDERIRPTIVIQAPLNLIQWRCTIPLPV